MSNVFIINAGQHFEHSKGELNRSLALVAEEALQKSGHQTQLLHIEDGYDIKTEIERFLWADVIIYQQPAWWMGSPWQLKKYIDEIFTFGHGKLYKSDGRSRSDVKKQYGSGGLLQGKHYMISATWNAPSEAFTDSEQFFEGKGFDNVYLPFHKANQFLGLSPLASFACYDVIKNPEKIETYFESFREHLNKYIS